MFNVIGGYYCSRQPNDEYLTMCANLEGDVFYGIYTFDENLSINLESATPFYKALNKVVGIYIVSPSTIESFYGEPVCGFVQEYQLQQGKKYAIYVADDLSHCDRLVTIGHELIHIILVIHGYSFDLQEAAEQWIDGIAKRFYQRNSGFLNWAYKQEARIAN